MCGHSIENDLKVLKLVHQRIIDTSILYPNPITNYKFSLKKLAHKFLRKVIQEREHDSIEDAKATMELVKNKVRFGPSFGLPNLNLQRVSLLSSMEQCKVKSLVLDIEEVQSEQFEYVSFEQG